MAEYLARIENGSLGDTVFAADTLEEAWEEAEDWALAGDWPAEGCYLELSLAPIIPGKDSLFEYCILQVAADESRLDQYNSIHRQDGHSHTWKAPHRLVGGLEENPGVWSGGGVRFTFVKVCRCGAWRRTDTDENSNSPDGIEITYPDGLWPWGEDCEYPGQDTMTIYLIAEALNTGDWGIVEEFQAHDDTSANTYADEHYSHIEWYVLDQDHENINS